MVTDSKKGEKTHLGSAGGLSTGDDAASLGTDRSHFQGFPNKNKDPKLCSWDEILREKAEIIESSGNLSKKELEESRWDADIQGRVPPA